MLISDWSSDVCSSDLTDGRMLVRSGFFATPRMLAGDTESCDSSICLSSMFLSPLPFQTTAAPAERGERRERPERSAMKAGRSEERRVGKECVGQCRSRWPQSPSHKKNKNTLRY